MNGNSRIAVAYAVLVGMSGLCCPIDIAMQEKPERRRPKFNRRKAIKLSNARKTGKH